MARPMKRRCVCSLPNVTCFAPEGTPAEGCVQIGYDEFEVLRLLDYARLSQVECAQQMGVSRATVARLYDHVRQAVAEVLVHGKRLQIEGGDVLVCPGLRPECANEPFCCHRHRREETT